MTTTERLALFETAQHTLGLLVAMRAKWIYKEEQKQEPNENLIIQWRYEQEDYSVQSDALQFHDDEGNEKVIATFGPIVKAAFAEA